MKIGMKNDDFDWNLVKFRQKCWRNFLKFLNVERCELQKMLAGSALRPSSILALQENVSKCMKMFKILWNCMLLIENAWKYMKMHENAFRRCPSLCRRTPHCLCRVPCIPFSFYLFDFSVGSSCLVFFGIFREVFLQVVFHLGFQRCEGVNIL